MRRKFKRAGRGMPGPFDSAAPRLRSGPTGRGTAPLYSTRPPTATLHPPFALSVAQRSRMARTSPLLTVLLLRLPLLLPLLPPALAVGGGLGRGDGLGGVA